jgi:antitoxin (DNA-binding transcriptional repressor) of toxin-antitoxin stability system
MASIETTVSATEFKAKCLSLIDDMNRTKIPVVITKRGKRVAEMRPALDDASNDALIRASLKGSVLRYDDPFGPAIDPGKWNALK